jgi:hypothetical protein
MLTIWLISSKLLIDPSTTATSQGHFALRIISQGVIVTEFIFKCTSVVKATVEREGSVADVPRVMSERLTRCWDNCSFWPSR